MDINKLTESIIDESKHFEYKDENRADIIDRNKIIMAFENLRKVIFPEYFGNVSTYEDLNEYVKRILTESAEILTEQISLAMYKCRFSELNDSNLSDNIIEIVENFFDRIPYVARLLMSDIEATFNNDPAAECKSQIIISYPGITAITFYRLAHELKQEQVCLIPRIVTEYAHSLTGIDIHPGAVIGSSFCIDHGTGIVIGETTIIGDNVKIYQGVTLGALSIRDRESTINKKRHPTIENNVTLYAGCTVLGGNTVIGENSVIGGSAFIVKSIPKNTIVSIELPKLNFKSQK